MKSVYIYTHQGLGDMIACNGLVRTISEMQDHIYLFAKPNNTKNIIRMFSDESNIRIIPMEEQHIKQFMQINPNNNYLIVGHEKLHRKLVEDPNGRFDQLFYEMANIPFQNKWNKFYFKRDLEAEKEVYYDQLGLKEGEEFIFVHDDKERPITHTFPGVKVIKPERKDISIFDFLYTIEKANAVHCIDSSFLNLIDCIQLRKDDNLFFHKYVKIHLVGEGGTPTLKLNWKILDK